MSLTSEMGGVAGNDGTMKQRTAKERGNYPTAGFCMKSVKGCKGHPKRCGECFRQNVWKEQEG